MSQIIKFFFLFLVLFFIAFSVNNYNKNLLISRELSYVLNDLKTNYEIVKEADTIDAETLNTFISNDKQILNILVDANNADMTVKKRLRKELYTHLSKKYNAIKKYGILQFQFVLANNKSFLRMHKPDKYGDDLTQVRYTFAYTQKTHKPIFGFEQGRMIHGFRHVFPLFKASQYIGAYEISFSSDSFQNRLLKVNKLYIHFLINKKVFSSQLSHKNSFDLKYKQSIESPEYMLAYTKGIRPNYVAYLRKNIINKHRTFIDANINRCKTFSFYESTGQSVKVVSFLPIKDVKYKKTVAYIVSYTDNHDIKAILHNYKLINIILFIGLALLVYLFYLQFIRKKALKKTTKEQQKLLELFDKGDITLFRWRNDINWSIEYVSNNVSKLTGYTKEEFLSENIAYSNIIYKHDLQRALKELTKAFESNVDILKHNVYQINTKDKTKKWVEQTTLFIRDAEGHVTHFLGYLLDVSVRKELELELHSLNENLKKEIDKRTNEIVQKDKMLQEQAKLAAMGEMVGAIAHQWRQPLNSLSINIQNLDDDYEEGLIDRDFIDAFIAKQTKTINFMSKTIDDFRNFFRIDKIKNKFSVKKSIENTLSLLQAQLMSHNIQTTLQGKDFTLVGVESEFQQVILNIISNAKDAITENNIKYGKIEIRLENKKIVISDNAGGIPQEIINRIFEPYFTTKEQGMGTGLGLYMSKMIIEKNMGGYLHVNSEAEGAKFVIDFNERI